MAANTSPPTCHPSVLGSRGVKSDAKVRGFSRVSQARLFPRPWGGGWLGWCRLGQGRPIAAWEPSRSYAGLGHVGVQVCVMDGDPISISHRVCPLQLRSPTPNSCRWLVGMDRRLPCLVSSNGEPGDRQESDGQAKGQWLNGPSRSVLLGAALIRRLLRRCGRRLTRE